jgi:hypothetical protein
VRQRKPSIKLLPDPGSASQVISFGYSVSISSEIGNSAEALDEMRRAIEFHLEGLREDGQPIPQPSTVAATIITLDAA